MQQEQLALFGDDAVVGSGRPVPWPTATVASEPETSVTDPDQLAFDNEAEAA